MQFMNITQRTPAQRVIADVQNDADANRLRAKLADFEGRLQSLQTEIADAIRILNAQTQGDDRRALGVDGSLAVFDLETLVRPTRGIEATRDSIRQMRREEAELSEALRIVRRMLLQREDAAYYAAFRDYLVAEQVRIGGRSVDHMLGLAETMQEERALRAPLKAVSRFEKSDIWAVHSMWAGVVRDLIERLQKHGYKPTDEQLRRLEAIERAERE